MRCSGAGDNDNTISKFAPDGISLAAIRLLYEWSKRVDKLEAEVDKLEGLAEKQNEHRGQTAECRS